jgi:branched-chain amino acid transport system substrate-binding protein
MAEERHMGQEKDQIGRRTALRWAAISASLLMAGCAVVPKGPPKTVDRPPEPVEQPTVGLPTDAQRHRIAVLVPITGRDADVGQSIANAANLAVLDSGGKRIRVTIYDTATGASGAARKALADGNKLILGPLLSEDVRAVSAIASPARVPIIAYSNDSTVAGGGTYLMGFTPGQSVFRVVSYARSKGMSRFAGLVPNQTFGQRTQASLTRAVETHGGSLVSVGSYENNPASLTAAINSIGAKGKVDAILIADSGTTAARAIPIIRRGPLSDAKIMGTDRWNTEAGLARAPALHGAWFASVTDGIFNQLTGKYRTRFGKDPHRLASLGYDSVLLATKIASSWKVGTAFPVGALNDPGGFSGIDGAFRFSGSGIADRALEVQEVRATGPTVISPAPKTFVN